METGHDEGCPFTAGKQLSDKNPVSPFLLRYLQLLEAKMVNCTHRGKLLTIWSNSFGSRVWQNAEKNILEHVNQMQCYGTGPARLVFSKAKGFTVDLLSCRFSFLGQLRGLLKPPSNNSKTALTMAGKTLLHL